MLSSEDRHMMRFPASPLIHPVTLQLHAVLHNVVASVLLLMDFLYQPTALILPSQLIINIPSLNKRKQLLKNLNMVLNYSNAPENICKT